MVNHTGAFFTYTLRIASYYNEQQFEDALTSINLTRFSKLYVRGKNKIRHQVDLGFAQLLNQREKRALDINNENGITNFKADSLVGNKRFNSRYEIIVFTPWKFIGFHIATTAQAELSYLVKDILRFYQGDVFSSLSVGLRIRNENLIFNTIEARIFYYPRVIENISHIGFSVQANLKIKYPTTLVYAPATVFN